ncbi:hypothetical protein MMC12_002318 [Toensbergia leucococca]|nr:hypothetical protein [Toensbergia leucococca]
MYGQYQNTSSASLDITNPKMSANPLVAARNFRFQPNPQYDVERIQFSAVKKGPGAFKAQEVNCWEAGDLLYHNGGQGPYTCVATGAKNGQAHYQLRDTQGNTTPYIPQQELRQPRFRIGDKVQYLDGQVWSTEIYTVSSIAVARESFEYGIYKDPGDRRQKWEENLQPAPEDQ